MQTPGWYKQWAQALQRVMDTATARDGEKPGTPGWRKAEAEYQEALKSYRDIGAQVAARGPDQP
jgi:hypothetical protein